MNTEAKILVVDDVPDNLLLLCQFLEEQGYHVSLASDGELILTNIGASLPDLILLDICLSGINGYQVCSWLKENPQTQDIPVIFLSALDNTKEKVKAFQVGGADYITKPFQIEEVIARLENQLTIKRQKQDLENLQKQLLDKNQVLEQQNSHLTLLLKLTKVMNTAETIDDAIAQGLTQLCEVIGWDYGEAWVLNSEGTELEKSSRWYATHPGLDWFYNPTEKAVLSFQKELVEKIAHSQDIEWIANLNHFNAQHFHHSATSWQKQARELGITSFLGVPIVFKGNVLAVLIFLSDCSADQKEGASVPTSSPSWLKLIRSVASQLGTLMQRLYTETALKEANEKLQYLVAYDGLTKIANRRRFDEYLDEQWRQGKRDRGELSLILCDLDAFKLYNDHFGHQAGDQCLQAVAEAVQKVVKRPLDLVARYGGEELAVLLPYTAQIGAFQLAEKIREAVKALQIPHPNSPVSYCVTVSVGVSSIIPREDSAPKNLIRMADEALYQAKNQGRDRVVLNNQLKEDCLKEI
jgi:diguanylate cyclase (GGDEF)-like protein